MKKPEHSELFEKFLYVGVIITYLIGLLSLPKGIYSSEFSDYGLDEIDRLLGFLYFLPFVVLVPFSIGFLLNVSLNKEPEAYWKVIISAYIMSTFIYLLLAFCREEYLISAITLILCLLPFIFGVRKSK